MTTTCKRITGFTLMELLIVLTILVALFALLLPMIFQRNRAQRIQQANTGIQQLEGQLEIFITENRRYPTTEEGLYFLAFVPDNYGMMQTMPITPAITPGFADPSMPMDGMVPNPMDGGGGTLGLSQTGMQGMGMTDPMGNPMGGPMGGIDPITGQMSPVNPMENPMTGGGTLGAPGTMGFSNLEPGRHNPQLYMQGRIRSGGIHERLLLDPWGEPYRYDNTNNAYGVNQYTWDSKPAIWSTGPDRLHGTPDDIRNWNDEDVQRNMTARQQMQMQTTPMSGGGTIGLDPNMMNMNQVIDPNTGSPMQPQQQWGNDPNMMMGPGGVPTGPGGIPTGPGGVPTGPGGIPTGPGGIPTGPGGIPTGPGGIPTGPGVIPTGPGGIPTGPGGIPTGPGGIPTGTGGIPTGTGGIPTGPGAPSPMLP